MTAIRAGTDAGHASFRHASRVEVDREQLERILRLRGADGVVSVYVDADPAEAASPAPAWAETVRVELRRLGLDGRLDEVGDDLDWAVAPRTHARGRAIFFGVRAGGADRIGLQMPLETSVTVAPTPRLLPLLSALDEGRPAGVVAATMAEVRIVEVAWGEAREIDRHPVAPPAAEWSELKEPNPLHEEDRRAIARGVAARTAEAVRRRGWTQVVLAGNDRLTHPVAEALRSLPGLAVMLEPWDVRPEQSSAEIASSARGRLLAAHRAAVAADAERAIGAAAGAGKGAVGLADVLRAVTDGRAAWVALDRDAASRPGTVEVAREAPMSPADAVAGIVEGALRTDARIAVASTPPGLASGGAVALLRW